MKFFFHGTALGIGTEGLNGNAVIHLEKIKKNSILNQNFDFLGYIITYDFFQNFT